MTAEDARRFRALIGANYVIEGAAVRASYASDISGDIPGKGDAVAALVPQPGTREGWPPAYARQPVWALRSSHAAAANVAVNPDPLPWS